MQNLSDIISELRGLNKTTDKRKLLEKHSGDARLRLLFKATYDSEYNYWIKADREDISLFGQDVITQELIQEIIDTLHGRKLTGNAAREYLREILYRLTPAEGKILVQMINGDMDCKVSVSLINSTWPGTIYIFPVMLADKFNEKTAKQFYDLEPKNLSTPEKPKMVVQLKADGGRLEYIAGDAGFSRNGSKIQTYDQFDFLNDVFKGYVVDGELVSVDPTTGTIRERKISNGLYTKAVRGTISKAEAATLHYIVWDCIPIHEFHNRIGTESYEVRLKRTSDLIDSIHQRFKSRISLIPTKFIRYVHEAQLFYEEMLGRGEEGAMLKRLDAIWEDDRCSSVLKLKEEKEATLRCVGVIPHNKKEGQIGSLELATECGLLKVSCGSGLSDDDRKKPASEYIWNLIDIKFNALIKAKHRGEYSMFLPIFKNIRYDVTAADTLEKLK